MSGGDERGWVRASPSLLKRVVVWIKQAGAEAEETYGRNGFLSYHAETHALGMGLAAGYVGTAHEDQKLLGLVYGSAVYGRAHAANGSRRKILRDVSQEWHYALMGIVCGSLVGVAVRAVAGIVDVEVPRLVDVASSVGQAVLSGGLFG